MAPVSAKRRRVEDEVRRPKKKKPRVKRQAAYHSSSEDDDDDAARDAPKFLSSANAIPAKAISRPRPILKQTIAVSKPQATIDELDAEEDEDGVEEDDALAINTALNAAPVADSDGEDEDVEENDEPEIASEGDRSDPDEDEEEDDDDDAASESELSTTSSAIQRAKRKRNDPTAFATSISKILDTKLTSTKRSDPVLSRSKSAADANKSLADSKLDAKARAQIRAERKQALDRGRVKDVLGLETEGVDTGKIQEEEKRLKKTAQRGVVKLFNAVRAAQVKAEEAVRQTRAEGVVGMQKREERVNEMSKQGFLDLISSGGKKAAAA